MDSPSELVALLSALERRLRAEKDDDVKQGLLLEQGRLLQALMDSQGWDATTLSGHLMLSQTHCKRLLVSPTPRSADSVPSSPLLEKHIRLLNAAVTKRQQIVGLPPFWPVLLCQAQVRQSRDPSVVRGRLLRDSLERFHKEITRGHVDFVIHSKSLLEKHPRDLQWCCSFYRQKDFFLFVKRSRVERLHAKRLTEAEKLSDEARERKQQEAEDLWSYLETGNLDAIPTEARKRVLVQEVLRDARPAGEVDSDPWKIMVATADYYGVELNRVHASQQTGTDVSFRRWRHSQESDDFRLDLFCGTYRHLLYLRTNGYLSISDESARRSAQGVVVAQDRARALQLPLPPGVSREAEIGLMCLTDRAAGELPEPRKSAAQIQETVNRIEAVWRAAYGVLAEQAYLQVPPTEGHKKSDDYASLLFTTLEEWLGGMEWLPDGPDAFARIFPELVRQLRPTDQKLHALHEKYFPEPDSGTGAAPADATTA